MKANKDKTKILSPNIFPVVGIGASAGGLAAFKKFLKAIPENSGMAYVLVQHLDPNHESLLADLLQKVTPIPVLEISDDIKVAPDHIYVIPSNKMMVANDGVLQLTPRPASAKNVRNLPIDLFFTSLAEVHQSHAIGVVLSGTASDGTAGLKAIKDHGGITFAQDDESAEFSGMPQSAVRAGVVDFILSPEKMPLKISEVNKNIFNNGGEEETFLLQDEDVMRQIVSLLRIRKGTDFTYYKQTTIRRRILRRMALNKNSEPSLYLKYLREHKAEQDILYQDLLISVTSFFRDSKTFDHLSESVFPLIALDNAIGEPIRIWVAGCATGEEAYSIAICFKEFLGASPQRVQIFATDISEPAILKARSGTYSKSQVDNVSKERLTKFFTKTTDGYQVVKTIRDMCVFARHNFIKDPPFGKMNFISCRNALIYMEAYLQRKALSTFHYSLNPKGILWLGKTETTSSVPDLFSLNSKADKLFLRKDVPGRSLHMTQRGERSPDPIQTQVDAPPKRESTRSDFQKTADDIVLGSYSPAGVIVNEAMDIVNFRGNTTIYLAQSSGKPSHNLLKMAKHGLAFELRTLLHKTKKTKATASKKNILLKIRNKLHYVSLEAIPMPGTKEPHYLILFHEVSNHTKQIVTGKKTVSSKAKKDEKDLRIQQLERELALTHEDMRSITEDQETANEELQTDNEELLSSSEELQSLNEELETSKEELQSTNEELTVVNQEIVSLNEQVTDARDYSEAIVSTVREPLLVLDKNLVVRTANRAYYKFFRAHELETEGKYIHELGNGEWNISALREVLEKVLPAKSAFYNFEITQTFAAVGERVMLLSARELVKESTSEKLILLAIQDVTEQKLLHRKESALLARFQNLILHAPTAICILKGKAYVMELANELFLGLIEKGEDIISKPLFESVPELKIQGIKELLDGVLQSGTAYEGNEVGLNLPRTKKNTDGFYNFVFQPVLEQGEISGVIVVVTEVTEQVTNRKKMERQATMVQNLLMTAPGFICTLTGPDHVYEVVNEQYQMLFGSRQIKGKPVLVALPELEGQGFDKILDHVYLTGEPYVGMEIPITLGRDENLEPELRYFNFSYQPIYDEHAKITSILVFGYEVTEQVNAKDSIIEIEKFHSKMLEGNVEKRTQELKEVNELLVLKNEELVRMNSELQSFSYVASHDLQEPLRKIQTFALRILESENESLSEHGKDYFLRMQNAAKRMQTLIEDLLAFSRVNTVDRKFENTDLTKVLIEVKNDLRETIEEKNAVIELRALCPAYIIRFQFKQLMLNLLGNAIKFARTGIAPHILIKSEIAVGSDLHNRLVPEKEYCHISVSDNGIGFEPEFKEKIFELFQQLHGKDKYKGTGIGLSIVKKIVENHNGVIIATSELSKGATFDIYIPTSQAQVSLTPSLSAA